MHKKIWRSVEKYISLWWAYLKKVPKSTYIAALVLIFIPLSIFGPLYQSGYILQYDMLFAPFVHIPWESISQGTGLHHSLAVLFMLKFFSCILPMDVVQKLILSVIFLLSALSVYRSVPVRSPSARLVAGLMYSVNPFTYDRLMAGHWLFLLAYSITPFAVKAFYVLYTRPSRKAGIVAALWWTVAAVISSHHLLLLGLVFVVFGAVFVRSWRTLLYTLSVLAGVFLLNAWWLVPLGSTANFTQSFGLEHFYAFATRADFAYGLWVTMFSLQGFWYIDWQGVRDMISWWPLVFLVWLTPVFAGLAGLYTYITSQKKLLVGLLICGILALIFAAGPHSSVWQLNTWLHAHIPGMSGMREAQKFLALLALMYAFFAAFGMDWLLRRYQPIGRLLVPVAATATLVLALPIFWAAHGQLKLSQYPKSWQSLHDTLYAPGSNEKVVILPWSVYASDTFVPGSVGNPARLYFGDRAIVGQRMNMPGVTDPPSPVYGDIEKAIDAKDGKRLAAAMRQKGAGYILITDPVHKEDYEWLYRDPDFEVKTSTENVVIITLTKH